MVYVDTGSTDDTIHQATMFAAEHGLKNKLKVKRFKWIDDFAAARNYADQFATGEWLFWCDLDDTVTNLQAVREMAERATPDVAGFFCHYTYAADPSGNCISELWRERVVRNDGVAWTGRLHEHKVLNGNVVQVPEDTCDWVHHRHISMKDSGDRNLQILKRWDEEEPDNPRIIQSIGLEYMGAGDWPNAVDTFERYLTFEDEQVDRRAQAARYLVQALCQLGQFDKARETAYWALEKHWRWTDTHLSLAEIAQSQGDPELGYHHARRALEMGKPRSILILNPIQYSAHPRALMAICCIGMGRYDEAMALCEEALALAPGYELITSHLPAWRGLALNDQVVNAWTACVDLLKEHGELLKAKALLDTLPYFARDDARMIAKRVEVWREIETIQSERRDLPLEPNTAAANFVVRHVKEAA